MRKVFFTLLFVLSTLPVYAADSIRAVRLQAPTSGTQDYEVAGFGNPTAAIAFAHNSSSDADADNMTRCIAFWDGTTDVLHRHMSDDGEGVTSNDWTSTRNDNFISVVSTNLAERTATIALAPGGNGVRLTWNTESGNQPWVTVLLIKANNAASGTDLYNATENSTTVISGLGFDPNFVFFANDRGTALNASSSIGSAWGFSSDESGGITNYAVGERFQYADPLVKNIWVSDAYSGLRPADSGALQNGYDLTSYDTGGFTVTTRLGSNAARFIYLAVEFADVPETFQAVTTTAAGDWDPYTDTQERQSVLFFTTAASTLNTSNTSGDAAGGFGYYFVSTEGDKFGASMISEDAVTPNKDASGRHSAKLIIQPQNAGAPLFDATNPAFDSTGLVFADADVNEDATARYVIGVGFGAVAAAGEAAVIRRHR